MLAGIPYPATAYVEEEAEALLLPVQQFKDWVEQSQMTTFIPQKFQGDTYWIWNCKVCHANKTQKPMHT